MPLPPYLTSFASSRAHHALLVRLDGAPSSQAEDTALRAEVERCRRVLTSHPSSSKIADTLIILLHCATMAHTRLDIEFALVPALQLAESGRTMRERRRGYLYLAERLPPGHELHLMLVNTIRKDLASSDEPHILAALHAIAHLPGPDLAPAVVPLLASKRLLEHHERAIRQRTIQAISALAGNGSWPLSLREIARRIRHEDDASALAAALRIYAQALEAGAREPDATRRRRQFDSVFAAAARRMDADSPLVIAAIRALAAIVRTLPRQYEDGEGREAPAEDELVKYALAQVRSLFAEAVELHTAPGVSQWARACLFETSALAATLFEIDGQLGPTVETLMEHLRRFLLPPREKGKGKAGSSSSLASSAQPRAPTPADAANNRILALRCFGLLPAVAWQDGLTEAHMAALMGGVDSSDTTLRRETLRLLARVDRNLPQMTLESHLESIRTGKGVPGLEGSRRERDAVAAGRAEAAIRALETNEVLAEGQDDTSRGNSAAQAVWDISRALRDAGDAGLWLKGVQAVLGDLQAASREFRTAFIASAARALSQDPGDATLAVLLTTVTVEYPGGGKADEAVVDALLPALPLASPSVQELIVLALVPLLAGLAVEARGTASQRTLEALKQVTSAEGAIKHMVKRCTQVSLIVERELVDDAVRRSKSRALNDILDAILAIYAEATKPATAAELSPSTTPLSASLTASALRYDAYASPTTGSPRVASPPPPPLLARSRAAELSHAAWAMGRSSLVEPDELAMDDLAIGASRRQRSHHHLHGGATPTDRTPRLRASDP